MAATTTQNYLGKCKTCDYVIFATGADVKPADDFKAVTAGTGVYRVGNNGCFARCSNRHKFFAVKLVKGTYSPDHKCDSRCLNAKGWSCTCSCGGANHGRGHVATVVQAASIDKYGALNARTDIPEGENKAPVTERIGTAKHLGEVGKTIKGDVEVASKIFTRNGNALYVFHTVNGAHVIKWFVRPEFDPQYEVGYTFTLRAHVKAHDEFRGVPETIVTYVEEIR